MEQSDQRMERLDNLASTTCDSVQNLSKPANQ